MRARPCWRPNSSPIRRSSTGRRLAVVAGGFSYADSLGAGRMLALDLSVGVGDELRSFVAAGRPLIGICNGFQVLTRSGLLPGALGHNAAGTFDCRWVELAPEPASVCVWTAGLDDDIHCPIARTVRAGTSTTTPPRSPPPDRSRCGTPAPTPTGPSRTSPACVIRPASCSVSCPIPRTTSSPGNIRATVATAVASDARHLGLHLFANGVRHARDA